MQVWSALHAADKTGIFIATAFLEHFLVAMKVGWLCFGQNAIPDCDRLLSVAVSGWANRLNRCIEAGAAIQDGTQYKVQW